MGLKELWAAGAVSPEKMQVATVAREPLPLGLTAVEVVGKFEVVRELGWRLLGVCFGATDFYL